MNGYKNKGFETREEAYGDYSKFLVKAKSFSGVDQCVCRIGSSRQRLRKPCNYAFVVIQNAITIVVGKLTTNGVKGESV